MVLSFPPEVFARIEPGLYLQRHLSIGLRPGLRKFDEFRPVQVQKGVVDSETSDDSSVIGSALVKVAGTSVICAINLSTSESGPGGVFPNVEIVRGGASRNAPPTQEEMILSQLAFNNLEAILPKDLFQHESLPDLHLVLNASVQVLSRSGPCYDAVWNAIVAALKDAKLPPLSIDPDTNQVVCGEGESALFLQNSDLVYSSTFGVVELEKLPAKNEDEQEEDVQPTTADAAVLADIEGDPEEACVASRIHISCDSSGKMSSASIRVVGSTASGGNVGIRVTRGHVAHAIELAQKQAKVLETAMA